jgi:hypothetical protein
MDTFVVPLGPIGGARIISPTPLSASQRIMLRCSASQWDKRLNIGHGVTLRGAANWRTARALTASGLGVIVNDDPGLFYASERGLAALTLPIESDQADFRKALVE